MSNEINAAFNVEVTTKIEWWELGRMVAKAADNFEQANFLHGLAFGLLELPNNTGHMQISYIRDSLDRLPSLHTTQVNELLDSLRGDSDA